jgi:UDP:flavonoid glycosyltransferase YjiC (YdhE family)
MARILVVTWDGGGNLPPMLGIASELRGRNHEVLVLGHTQQREKVVSAGLKFVGYRHARSWSPTVAATGARFLFRFLFEVFTDPGTGTDVHEELARGPVNLALVGSTILGGLRAAEQAGIPTVVLMHTSRHYHTHKWSRGPIGVVAAARGMRPGRLWNTADKVLIATDSALDPATRRRLPANVRYTGVVQAPVQPRVGSGEPLVLISLSTIFFEGQESTLQTILDAFEGLGVRGILTTGAVAPGAIKAPANVEVHKYLPHDGIMPRASLVVGHGGHSTTMRALAHGLPLLILPMHSLLDQAMIGKSVADAGAGIVLAKTASTDEIRRAVEALLGDPSYQHAAKAIGVRLHSQNGAIGAADEIETLLKTGRRNAIPAA